MACPSCGFIVCIDCFELRNKDLKSNSKLENLSFKIYFFKLNLSNKDKASNKDLYSWLYCYKYDFDFNKLRKKKHLPSNMIYVQFIPSQSKVLFFYLSK